MSAPEGGLDYSTKALSFGVVDGQKLLECWEDALGVDLRNRLITMRKAARRLQEAGVTRVFLEAVWFRGTGKQGQQAASNAGTLSLHRVANHFEAIAVASGLEVAWVPVGTWRSVVLGNGRPKDPKAESIRFCRLAFGYQTANHNQADGICLAAYGAALQRSRIPSSTTSGGRARH